MPREHPRGVLTPTYGTHVKRCTSQKCYAVSARLSQLLHSPTSLFSSPHHAQQENLQHIFHVLCYTNAQKANASLLLALLCHSRLSIHQRTLRFVIITVEPFKLEFLGICSLAICIVRYSGMAIHAVCSRSFFIVKFDRLGYGVGILVC